MQMAATRSTRAIVRLWKMVPEVTEYCFRQAAHLKRWRVEIA
jgi:hypothetical protein